jgi:hypothetical protein
MTILSPLGFATQAGGTPSIGQTVNLTGSGVTASAGFVTTQVSTNVSFSPIGFAQKARNFSGKSLGDNVNVNLTGAAARAQGEQLDGAHYYITPSGAEGLGQGGDAIGDIDTGVSLLNPDAQTREFSGSEIDDRTGFKVYPGELVTDEYSKKLVHPKFRDEPQEQEGVKSARNLPQRGPQAPELDDNFLESQNADAINNGSATGVHNVSQTLSTDGTAYFSVYCKNIDHNSVALTLEDNAGIFVSAGMDLTDGTSTGISNTGGLGVLTNTRTLARDGWYRHVIGATFPAATSITATISIPGSDPISGNQADDSYAGTDTAIAIWGAMLSRTNIEYTTGPENLLSYPEDFSSWTNNNVTVSTNTTDTPYRNIVLASDL